MMSTSSSGGTNEVDIVVGNSSSFSREIIISSSIATNNSIAVHSSSNNEAVPLLLQSPTTEEEEVINNRDDDGGEQEKATSASCIPSAAEKNVVEEKSSGVWDRLHPSAKKLHERISTAIKHEGLKSKGRDYVFRLTSELSFAMYIKDLVHLSSSEYYNIPLTTVKNFHDVVLSGSSFKPVVPNKSDFFREFTTLYVKQYCNL
mmetsp:Transcript_10969/g.16510  ORF Transcript_10969/g.16510 Transcript_10969/m.16510 type:complete len:203 (+) Transcript_10969:228-836(+)